MTILMGLDLNLLLAFDALMENCSVTLAARAVGRSQPAMSSALSRLRDIFHDELLVRSGNAMRPTPRALEAHARVKEALTVLEGVISEVQQFDAGAATRRFHVAMAEDVAFYILPALTRLFDTIAPGIELDIHSTAHLTGIDLVLAGDVEMSVGILPSDPSTEIVFENSFTERLVVIADARHPAFQATPVGKNGALPMDAFLRYPHVSVQPSAATQSRVDIELARLGLERRVMVRVPHFLVVPHLLPGTELIACLAERLARRMAPMLGLAIKDPPIKLGPYGPVLAWHRRYDRDLGHQWLRRHIAAACREMDGKSAGMDVHSA